MAELEIIAIRSSKNPDDRWMINKIDYDPAVHILWESPYSDSMHSQPVAEPLIPTGPDFEQDQSGNIIWVTIINPDERRSRLRIPYTEYDPDIHKLWSSHPRFQGS